MRLGLSFFIISLALPALVAEARAQTPTCPAVSIECPTDLVTCVFPFTVSVEVAGGEGLDLRYHWKVSAGTITGGQGTAAIGVDTTGTGENITVTVEVDGLPSGCDHTESCTLGMVCDPPFPRKFDDYKDLSPAQENKRLADFATQMREEPGAQAYIFYFGPRDTDKRLERAREFLTSEFGIDPGRITVKAVHGEKFAAELWIRPAGAAEPKPSGN